MAEKGPYTVQKVSVFREQISRLFPEIEQIRIESALNLMLEIHADQDNRPDGSPYVEHLLDVATSVINIMDQKDPDQVIGALLHDSVEDQAEKLAQKNQNVSLNSITENALDFIGIKFGERVQKIVRELTNPDFEKLLKERGLEASVDNRNKLYVEHVTQAISDPDIILIKYSDFSGNAMHLDQITDPERKLKLARKYHPVFQSFIDRFSDLNFPVNITNEKRNEIIFQLRQAQMKLAENW
jgi:(p)ppGpp synthase/HD superfamily hydrolase